MVTETEEPRPSETEEVRPDVEPPEEEEGGPVKSFLEHLEDLRWVLIKSGAALILGMLVCLIAGNHVMGILTRPLHKARISYPGTNQVITVRLGTNQLGVYTLTPELQRAFDLGTNRFLAVQLMPVTLGEHRVLALAVDPKATAEEGNRLHVQIINLAPAGGFIVALQIAFYGGIVLAAPFIFYFVALFVFPALKMREKYFVYRGLGFGFGLFMAGVLFCYFGLMPLALTASVKYSNWLGISAHQWRAEEYISFTCKFMVGMGLGFQMPVVLLTLVRMGVLSYRTLSKARSYMIVINLILGAVLTTPEVLTQIMMFIPLQILYEVSVGIAWYWERRDRKKAEAESRGQATT